jgi:Tol biopolymer transport system component
VAGFAGGPVACTDATPGLRTPSGGVVLVRVVNGSNELVGVRLSDGAERQLTATPDRQETWPYWSEVAQRLVFQVSSGGRGSDLVLWSPQSGETPLAPTPQREERWPAWSPRSASLVYAFRGGRPPAGLALLETESLETRLAAATGPNDYPLRPSFAPDGRRLVAQRRGPEGSGSQLWLVEPDGGSGLLTRDPAWFDMKPFFDRHGTRIIFTRRRGARGPGDVASIAVAGGEVRTHASLPDADDHSGRPSPTRDELAFVSDRDGASSVYLASLPDGPPRRLTKGDRNVFAPRWSPDGEKLAVITTSAGEREPRLADRRSLERTRVLVLDREGRLLLDVPGVMPSWMTPWP